MIYYIFMSNTQTKKRKEMLLMKTTQKKNYVTKLQVGLLFGAIILSTTTTMGVFIMNSHQANQQPTVVLAKEVEKEVSEPVVTETPVTPEKEQPKEVPSEEPKQVTVDDLEFSHPFINRLKKDVYQVSKDYGVFPSVMMAQAIVESGWGESALAVKANNFFGVKARDGQDFVVMNTREEDTQGNSYYIDAEFAKYSDLYSSMEQNALVLTNNPTLYSKSYRVNSSHYTESTLGLTTTYATDQDYYKTLNRIIEQYGLEQLDNLS